MFPASDIGVGPGYFREEDQVFLDPIEQQIVEHKIAAADAVRAYEALRLAEELEMEDAERLRARVRLAALVAAYVGVLALAAWTVLG